MKATPDDQRRLLDLQALDSTLDRLAHRRRTLPEIARADELGQRFTGLRDAIITAETDRSDLQREQRKAEGDVEQVRTRSTRDRERLDSGAVASPKELESLQSEIASLQRRQSELEDAELEVMERLEQAETRIAELTTGHDSVAGELASVEAERDKGFAEIDAETEHTAGERSQTAATIPDDLLQLYEKLRRQHGGVGAAPLVHGRCEGCHLTLNPGDLGRVRAAAEDEVVRCEECRRILVRVGQSG
ncbi:MAG: zinc ribbon domain-containing protein [Streptosporangiales bacterium]